MNATLTKVLGWLRQLAAAVAAVEGAVNIGGLPTSVRVGLVTAGTALLTAEHVVAALAPPKPAAPEAAPVVTTAAPPAA